MKRFNIETHDDYDLIEAEDGWVVEYDDVAAAIASERAVCAALARSLVKLPDSQQDFIRLASNSAAETVAKLIELRSA